MPTSADFTEKQKDVADFLFASLWKKHVIWIITIPFCAVLLYAFSLIQRFRHFQMLVWIEMFVWQAIAVNDVHFRSLLTLMLWIFSVGNSTIVVGFFYWLSAICTHWHSLNLFAENVTIESNIQIFSRNFRLFSMEFGFFCGMAKLMS